MTGLGSLLLGTVVHRPYVFLFFVGYLVAAVTKMGWVRAAVFTSISFVVAFAAEFSSTRNGIPYGLFQYVDSSRAHELWLSNVPLWSPLLTSVLAYLAFQLAVLLYSPLESRRRDLQVLDTIEIRGSLRVLVTAAALLTVLDVVIDPLTLRGDRWFLGGIYSYPEGGLYFGLPLTDFAGRFLVGLVILGLYQRVERAILAPTPWMRAGQAHLPFGGLLEPAIYVAIVSCAIGLTLWIGETLLATIGVFIFGPLALVFAAHLMGTANHATAAEREAHRRDFPRTRTLA